MIWTKVAMDINPRCLECVVLSELLLTHCGVSSNRVIATN
jgi:hypothetical protein